MAATRSTTVFRLVVLAVTGLAACHSDLRPPVSHNTREIITLAAGTQCGRSATTPAARWLDNPGELHDAYRRMMRQSVGAHTMPDRLPDFERYGVLQVFMGQQSTGGYQLRLLHPRIEYLATGAMIRVEWLSPPPGARTTLVITSPCLLLAIPRGTWQSLIVTDQDGRSRAVAGR
jgi:PrcB C-terminal